jgi:hypothetical protein
MSSISDISFFLRGCDINSLVLNEKQYRHNLGNNHANQEFSWKVASEIFYQMAIRSSQSRNFLES